MNMSRTKKIILAVVIVIIAVAAAFVAVIDWKCTVTFKHGLTAGELQEFEERNDVFIHGVETVHTGAEQPEPIIGLVSFRGYEDLQRSIDQVTNDASWGEDVEFQGIDAVYVMGNYLDLRALKDDEDVYRADIVFDFTFGSNFGAYPLPERESVERPSGKLSDSVFSAEKMKADLAGIYEKFETGKEPSLTCSYSKNVKSYIGAKAQANLEAGGGGQTKTNFTADASLVDENDGEEYLKQLYAVEVNFVYADADGKMQDFESGYGTEVLVVIDKTDGYKVVDMIESMNGFDDSLGGEPIMPDDLAEMLASEGGSTMPEIEFIEKNSSCRSGLLQR